MARLRDPKKHKHAGFKSTISDCTRQNHMTAANGYMHATSLAHAIDYGM